MEPTPNTQHPYAQPSSPMQPVPPLAQLSPQTVHPQAAPTVAGISALDYDFNYNRMPAEYEVPDEYRRPYGRAPGDIRGPGYFYAVGGFALALFSLVYSGIQSLTTLSRAASPYRPYEIVQVTNVLMGGLLPALMAFILGIYAFKVSGKTKTKTSASSRTTTFGSLAIVLGGLSILGLIGSAVFYVLAFF